MKSLIMLAAIHRGFHCLPKCLLKIRRNLLQTAKVVVSYRLVVIFQETARNHFWEAGMLMQSYMLETVQ